MGQPVLSSLSSPAPTIARRIRGWRDAAISVSSPPSNLHNRPARSSVSGKAPVYMAEVYSDPQSLRYQRTKLPGCDAQMHLLHLQLEGESINRQSRREAHLKPGDFTICDDGRPFEIEFCQPIRMLVVGISDDLIKRYLQYPQGVTAVRIGGDKGVGGIVSEFLRSVWNRCLYEPEFEIDVSVTDAMLGLVAHAYRLEIGPSVDQNTLAAAHRARIVDYIEANLEDPKLTPTRIAETFRITTRYLHHLFSEEEETIARYILRRRLEDCARALTAPTQRKRTITSIAFDHGFSSATHFGRVFRSRYNLTPREYRRRFNFCD
ncbi:MAG: helix-turn-helix domain-containing protein [Woeseiaceae bacterium]|jgi:AraC family transcriptional activator of tynA and feaB